MGLRFQLLLLAVFAPLASMAQATTNVEPTPELSLILEPGLLAEGVPQAFTFHLINIGQKDLHIPEPDIDCGNATTTGSVWLNEAWLPPSGIGLSKGTGVCDFVGSGLPSPPINELAQKWHVLKPGDSLYIQAPHAALHYDANTTGLYTFSGVYLPPSSSKEQVDQLRIAGITIPSHRVTSGALQYSKL